jgi:glycosyltransferase involved in cell wall biosynthesis
LQKALFLFTPGFPADENDTTCLPFLQQLCLSIKRVAPNLPLVIFTFQYPFKQAEYEWNGIRVISFAGNNGRGIWRLLLWTKVMFKFFSLRKEYHVSGILSIWLSECALVAKTLSRISGVKYRCWIVGQDARVSNKYVRFIKPKGVELIAFSDFISKQMQENFNITPSYLVQNGVNDEVFPALNAGERMIWVLGAGSLIKLKNFELFIEVIAEITRTSGIAVKAVICGDGPEKLNLEKQIDACNLRNMVELYGNVPHPRVLELMNDSHVFLHTSEYDSSATVLHEALYAGCKVVSTCPVSEGNPENFYLETNRDAIVERVVQLLSDFRRPKRVVVNSMDDSARQMLNIFIA